MSGIYESFSVCNAGSLQIELELQRAEEVRKMEEVYEQNIHSVGEAHFRAANSQIVRIAVLKKIWFQYKPTSFHYYVYTNKLCFVVVSATTE